MRILLPDATGFDMNMLPDQIDELHYCVLDYSNHNDVDFYFIPLIFNERYPAPVADLQIGPFRIQLPLDWGIIIADKNFGNMEVIHLHKLDGRDFDAFLYDPIAGFMPRFEEISIQNIFPDVTWYLPKLKYGHLLAVPLTMEKNSPCIFITRDTNRLPDVLDITKIFN